MNILALIIAVGALVVAYVALQRAAALEQRVTAARTELEHAKAEWNAARATLAARVEEICQQARHQEGERKFSPSMTIAQAMQLHPGVAAVLSRFKLDACSNCSISDVDTLEGACRSYGIDQAALLTALSKLIEPAGSDLLQMAHAGRN